MLHGRGGSAEDILSLADSLPVSDFTLFAPQADGHSWYPYSFLAVPAQNEPWLSGALAAVKALVEEIKAQGIPEEKIWFTGFSQGACLMLEFITRNAARYGGAHCRPGLEQHQARVLLTLRSPCQYGSNSIWAGPIR